jgi:hypothetical protein
MIPFITVLPDPNDRTEVACARFLVVWSQSAVAMQRISTFVHRHNKAASYGEARDTAPEEIAALTKRLSNLETMLAELADDAERMAP